MICPICQHEAPVIGEKSDRFFQTYQYCLCVKCQFLFEQDLVENPTALKAKVDKLYGGEYFEHTDEGWKVRGEGFVNVFKTVAAVYKALSGKRNISILDYGAGNGYLASRLADQGAMHYYDTYEKPTFEGNFTVLEKPEKADIMYAVELVEHFVDIAGWDFLKTVDPDVFIFTTGLSDNISKDDLFDWPYLNPNAGHMALYSTRALRLLGKKYGYGYFFYPNISCHIFVKNRFLSWLNIVALEYAIYRVLRAVKLLVKK